MGASPPREFELKLNGSVGDLRDLERRVRRRFGGTGEWAESTLISAYFDTRDQRLRKRAVSLRVRRTGRKYVQTVKAEQGHRGVALDRLEWEQEVGRFSPDLKALPTDARQRLGLVLPSELRRVFTVDVQRRKVLLNLAGDPHSEDLAVELVIDRGKVTAAGKTEVIAEAELELVSGPPGRLLQLAAELRADTGLRVGRQTKSSRGYRLVNGADPCRPVYASRFLLSADMTVSEAIEEILRHCLANVVGNEGAAVSDADPEGVHQMRIALRRIRSALSVFKKYLSPKKVHWLNQETKWLATSLGHARDWDVFIAEVLGAVEGYGIDFDCLTAMSKEVNIRHRAAYKSVGEAIGSDRYTAFILGLATFIETRAWLADDPSARKRLDQPLGSVVGKLLDRLHRKLMAEGANLSEQGITARHTVRIRLKRFCYASDFFEGLYPRGRVRPLLKAMKALQDGFGCLNDVAVAVDLIGELTAAKGKTAATRRRLERAAGQVAAWHARGLSDGEAQFLADWDTFAAIRPFWCKGLD